MFAKSLIYLTAALGVANAGTTYKATMTAYGSSDNNGSGNCVKTGACGFYFNPGYSAAVSQNLYGAGPGEGAGPACGKCYALTAEKDSTGNTLSGTKTVVVRVDNLCPASGNNVCSMGSLSETNSYGANVNFDLCIDSGANTAVFGGNDIGLAQGTAEEVDCSQWSGTQIGSGWKRHAHIFSG
ncbi:putative endoglucanase v-like protein [Lasiodiplodia theobromae]|uniref:Endoglucanase-5 n=2 Tax=Lasiodiplodia TaxID=66739 RepID=A0A5N5DEG0_9PEZI|nr:Endoglucanase v-like protein [Lasiodiplodia theobromae]KAB2575840.1 Endoglucanase-5 [Lasiodiplodia theobromae]KAF4546539.1 Endoglucanase v-like protein [Lasiodiplodia theobromae]KAF9631950.1 putative endoglucanase v-like protein [Lasiodiplodia theobromae]KAK0662836.1 Endoglucanase-5 [Lasiodiplodia hormozganensis]